jgi:hypothetical protein
MLPLPPLRQMSPLRRPILPLPLRRPMSPPLLLPQMSRLLRPM